MPTLTNINKPRVLILDPNATPLTTASNPPIKQAIAACEMHGCYYERVTSANLSTDQKAFSWDMILVPALSTSDTSYTNLSAALGTFTDTTIPVVVMGAEDPAQNATRQGVSGALTQRGTAAVTTVCTTFNWASRSLDVMYIYGRPAASLHASATSIASDGTYHAMWRFDKSSHPTLWVGANNGFKTNANIAKWWLAFQWMIDQQSTEAKKATIRQNIRPSYCLLRFDGLDDNNTVTAHGAGYLDTWYDGLLAGGLSEIWLAAVGQGDVDPGSTSATVAQWFVDRAENNGGLFRCINHHTDIVDNTGSTGPACTTDGAAFDNTAAAATEYERVCDILTGLGFQVGTDGYGAGYPNVQNGNDMNNPSAKFLADYGCILWLEESETYPNGSGAAVEAAKVRKPYPHVWNGAWTFTSVNDCDVAWAGDNTGSVTFNAAVIKAYIYRGSIYLHAGQIDDFNNFVTAYCSEFRACPDVFRSGPWEDCYAEIQRGNSAYITI